MENRQETKDISPIDTRHGAFNDTLRHRGINEELTMNRYHLALVIERMKQKPKGPRFEHVIIPLGIFLATLLSILPSDFRDYLGYEAAFWESMAVIIAILSASATIILFALWLRNEICRKEKTSLEMVDEVIKEMENDRKKVASMGHDDEGTEE